MLQFVHELNSDANNVSHEDAEINPDDEV